MQIDHLELQDLEYTTTNLEFMNQFENIMADKFSMDTIPYVRFLVGIMISAADNNDLEYFSSKAFEYHCMLLGIDHESILECIVRKQLIIAKKIPKSRGDSKKVREDRDEIAYRYDLGDVTLNELANDYGVCTKFIRTLIDESKGLK
jgi:hypothetical protein